MVNFEYRSGILEAADTATGREWCWFKGDAEVVISDDGQNVGTLAVPDGATVIEVKALIRKAAKRP
jgi:hypothetical protein